MSHQVNRPIGLAMMFLAAVLVSGCGREHAQEDLVTTHLTTLSVTPWGDLRKDLTPKFKSKSGSEEEASVIPVTQAEVERRIQTLIVQLEASAGLGGTSAPPLAAPPSSAPAELQRSLTPGPIQFGRDPFLVRQLATALVQETAMLNSYIEHVKAWLKVL